MTEGKRSPIQTGHMKTGDLSVNGSVGRTSLSSPRLQYNMFSFQTLHLLEAVMKSTRIFRLLALWIFSFLVRPQIVFPAVGSGIDSVCGTPQGVATQVGGLVLPEQGTVRALVIFVQFPDDTTSSGAWPLNSLPNYASTILDPSVSCSYTQRSLSHYYSEMSFGQLNLIGDVYPALVIPPDSMARYQRLGQNFGHVNRDILTILDSTINFALYDNWTSNNSGAQAYTPDGKVEMIVAIYRYLPLDMKAGRGDWTGIAGVGNYQSTFLTNDSNAIHQQVYIEMGYIESGSGVTISQGWRDWWDDSRNAAELMASVAHEFGHYLFGGVHYLSARGGPGLMGNGGGPAMNPFERERMGYLTYNNVQQSALASLPDYLTSNVAYRIPIPPSNLNSTEFFVVANHRKLSIYDGVGRRDQSGLQGRGLYIYHVNGASSDALDIECADSLWDWTISYWFPNPFEPSVQLPMIVRATPNLSGRDEMDLNLVYATPPGGSEAHWYSKLFTEGPGAQIIFTEEAYGDAQDAFNVGYNQLFSPFTNPSSNSRAGTASGIAVEVTGQNLDTINVHFFIVPLPPTLLSPSNGATGVSTSPTLSWNVSPGATTYRLQVSTSSGFGSGTIVFNDSTITDTSRQVGPVLNGTTYYWHVNAKNPAGTSNWSDPWSFTTVPLPPPPPTLVSPSNGATGVSTSPTLSWNTSSGATSYNLQVSYYANFYWSVVNLTGITATSYAVSGLSYNTTYYWRVSATNSSGTSDWPTAWSFVTGPPPPLAPTLVSPSDGAAGISTSPTLSWGASSGATSYRVQVSTNTSFSPTVVDQDGIGATSYGVAGLTGNTTYYWRVNATNVSGTSSWSPVWSFTTSSPPPGPPARPTLASPPDGAQEVPREPVVGFSWNESSGATSYHLQVSTNSEFSTTVVDQSDIGTNGYPVMSGLLPGTTYYWRVNASNDYSTSDWSSVWSFTTATTPGCETPTAPTIVYGSWSLYYMILLSWQGAHTSCIIDNYNVYRREYCGEVWTKVATVPGRHVTWDLEWTQWTDYPPPIVTCRYVYKISTVDMLGNEGPCSTEVIASMQSYFPWCP
jgi:hypothetical protein